MFRWLLIVGFAAAVIAGAWNGTGGEMFAAILGAAVIGLVIYGYER